MKTKRRKKPKKVRRMVQLPLVAVGVGTPPEVDRVVDLPRCAVLANDARCELPAGHDGIHVIWTELGILCVAGDTPSPLEQLRSEGKLS